MHAITCLLVNGYNISLNDSAKISEDAIHQFKGISEYFSKFYLSMFLIEPQPLRSTAPSYL